MKHALAHLARWTARLEAHPFFATMGPEPDLRRAMAFAPAGVFWVFSFQDLLRLNAERARDPAIRAILDQHVAEDSGHEEWFLQDLETIFGATPTGVRALFSRHNRRVRDATFALAAEVFRVDDDRLRLVLVEALEHAAGLFFGRVARMLAESGHAGRLAYFAGMHLEAEASHELHDVDHGAAVRAIVLPPELHGPVEALLARMFAAFTLIADLMLDDVEAARRAEVER